MATTRAVHLADEHIQSSSAEGFCASRVDQLHARIRTSRSCARFAKAAVRGPVFSYTAERQIFRYH